MTEHTTKGRRRVKDRKGMTIVEVLVVMLVISVLAAIAQPMLTEVIVKARAADAISEMRVVRVAAYSYQTEQQAWPSDVNRGIVPPGLEPYLPGGFDLVKDDYTLDYDYWGGSPFTVGITMITSDSILGRTALEMLGSPKWNSGDKYTWVIE
jgi:prepilin-type N-terminal cleavage/methylation domain-containing protein